VAHRQAEFGSHAAGALAYHSIDAVDFCLRGFVVVVTTEAQDRLCFE
jgi:hypothetical protein